MKFYVYELVVVPDGNVCYVGKGSGGRMYVHRKNLNCHSWSQVGLYRRLRELIASGKDFKPRKVFETDDEEAAFVEESRRIELYGFDNLLNSTNHRCRRASDVDVAMRQAMSKGQRDKATRNRKLYGFGLPHEHRAAIGAANLGAKRTPDQCLNISLGKKGKPLTEAHKLALHKPKTIDPETEKLRVENMAAKMRQLWAEGKMRGNTGAANPRLKGARRKLLNLLYLRCGFAPPIWWRRPRPDCRGTGKKPTASVVPLSPVQPQAV